MPRRPHRHFNRQMRGAAAVLICTAVSDIAIAMVAIANPDVASIALGTIATLTTAGVATAVPLTRATAS